MSKRILNWTYQMTIIELTFYSTIETESLGLGRYFLFKHQGLRSQSSHLTQQDREAWERGLFTYQGLLRGLFDTSAGLEPGCTRHRFKRVLYCVIRSLPRRGQNRCIELVQNSKKYGIQGPNTQVSNILYRKYFCLRCTAQKVLKTYQRGDSNPAPCRIQI